MIEIKDEGNRPYKMQVVMDGKPVEGISRIDIEMDCCKSYGVLTLTKPLMIEGKAEFVEKNGEVQVEYQKFSFKDIEFDAGVMMIQDYEELPF